MWTQQMRHVCPFADGTRKDGTFRCRPNDLSCFRQAALGQKHEKTGLIFIYYTLLGSKDMISMIYMSLQLSVLWGILLPAPHVVPANSQTGKK